MNLSWSEWAKEGNEQSLESGKEFSDAIEARVAELQRIEPEPKYGIAWCGM